MSAPPCDDFGGREAYSLLSTHCSALSRGTSLDPRFLVLAILLSLFFAVPAPAPSVVQSADPRIIILGYHEVEPGGVPAHETIPRQLAAAKTADEMQMYTIGTEAFREQLDALARHGYVVIPIAELFEFLDGRRATLPARAAVITADDGWRSVKTTMRVELGRRAWPFTAFLYPRVIERHSHHPFNLTWDEVAALAAQRVDFQSHTFSHPFLSRTRHPELSDAQYAEWLANELRQSRDSIAAHTGREVRFLAYPYGDYDAGVIAAAGAAGYLGAVTVTPGIVTRSSNAFALPRYLIFHDTTLAELESWLEPPRK
ncbi:MAG: polysaccharide deacetylase [Acidobacteria bacterium]|nr:polysaccharide deacetylase [Acidobacteriota bacterium]